MYQYKQLGKKYIRQFLRRNKQTYYL